MNKIRYSPEAEQDLIDIKNYYELELQNPSASKRILSEITQRIRTLEDFPRTGRKLSAIIDIETNYRFLGCGNYLAFYRIDGDHIFIGRIIHNRRNYIAILFGALNSEDK
ncbi:MAG: type II toxin-antitoxin system RelE/ParE family toxin [Defluviitaleaceae bacterium]|nr:type II toxin-antitoxin system RelE/ParE family toxin [Defluviitaleaceae bacterium]